MKRTFFYCDNCNRRLTEKEMNLVGSFIQVTNRKRTVSYVIHLCSRCRKVIIGLI